MGILSEAEVLTKVQAPLWVLLALLVFVTITSVTEGTCVGVTQVIWELLMIVTEDAAAPPKVTRAPVLKLLPEIVTVVPPDEGP